MEVKVISQSIDEFTREQSKDLQRVFRNYNPNLQLQEKATEYPRALNAAKLEKIFARPFIRAMDGHLDVVFFMAKNPNHLRGIFSGLMDGDIRLWDISNRKTVFQFLGHQGVVRGLTASTNGKVLIFCSADSTVTTWNVPDPTMIDYESVGKVFDPSVVYMCKNAFWGADHRWGGSLFANAGAQVDIWDRSRSQPVNTFTIGNDIVIPVRFNPGEPDIMLTSGNDRSITLDDLRMSTPTRELIMRKITNAISWNPIESMNFAAANEDCNCYSYDARKLQEAKCVIKDK